MSRYNLGLRRIMGIVGLCLWATSLSAQQIEPTLMKQVDKAKMNHWVDSVFDTLSSDERIGQLFMPVIDPKWDTKHRQRLTRYLEEIHVGGILFQKGNPLMQAEVTNRLQKGAKVPLFISLDGEWGLSMRLSGTTRFPKNMMLGAIEDNRLITEYGREVARQCREMGIHINFAPAVDVNSNVDNPVIGLRSFGESPQAVAEKGIAYARGLEGMGILSVSKHFPGHGDTSDDSHHTLPTLHHSRARLDSVELYPFKQYVDSGFAGVMTGHLSVPALDKRSNLPSSLSPAIITNLLQKEWGFRGLCFTDALAMKGATTQKKDNPSVRALLAGNDILLSPAAPITDFTAVKEAIEEGILDLEEMEAKCIKVLQYKYIAGLHNYRPVQTKGLTERINSPHAAWLAARLNAEAITLLKNEAEQLPLKPLGKKKIAALAIGGETGNAFQTMLNRYDTVACFSIGRNATAAQVQSVYSKLANYDVILCSVHTVRIPEHATLRQLAAQKELVYTFFTLPYFCKDYKRSIQQARALVLGYEDTPLSQEYAAQVIFGGIGAKGKLPVTIPTLYYAGSGLFTAKTRLGYHEPEEVGLDANRLMQIDSIVSEGLRKEAFPGCQVLVAKDGMVVYNRSFGYYDYRRLQEVTENSVYDLASVSKAAGTLLAVMKAYDAKLFTLNSRMGDLLPRLKGSDKEGLTVKELLYHQSGVVPTINFYTRALQKGASKSGAAPHFLPTIVSATRKPGFTREVARHLFVHDSFADSIWFDIRKSRLGPRGKYAYSCVNFILLQKMVETQLKRPLDELLQTEFLSPLGARYTTYNPLKRMDTLQIVPTEEDKTLRHQLLRGYVHDEAAAFQGGVSGNAGLFSNANDLAKLLQIYLNEGQYGGSRYLTAETCRLFTQSKSPTSRRGLGFDKPAVGSPKASPCAPQASAAVYGHTGFTGTCFWIDPTNGLTYIFLSNRVNPTRANTKLFNLDIRTRIQEVVYRALVK